MPRNDDESTEDEILTAALLLLQITNAAMPLIQELYAGQRRSISREDLLKACKERMDDVDARMLQRIQEAEDGVDSGE